MILIAGGSWTETVSWKVDSSGTLFVTGSGAVPDYEKGARNQPWIKHQETVTALVIEDGITRIGDRAFQSFRDLKRAVIGKGVTSIGEWAFQNCYKLSDVELMHPIELETGAFRSTPVEWEIHGAPSDAYTKSEYYTALRNVQLTGNYRNDMINIALSQVGYKEGNSEKELAGSVSGSGDCTEYGRSLESNGSAWCSEFASWCIRNANVPSSIIANSRAANATTFTANTSAAFYSWDATTFGGGSYLPKKGDLLLWSWDGKMHKADENLSHTSILWEITPLENGKVLLKTIDGNSNNQVQVREYEVSARSGQLLSKTGLVCYIVAPYYES
ncbi:MAG: leucine-rich repeat protein [Clostridia bacterium]|nr:leucine-rich repeat protein [Clostridia bacterium]